MQTILIILTLLLLALPCQAQEMVSRLSVGTLGGGVAAATSKYCDTKSGYLICEDFEGESSCQSGSADSNCRNTWVQVVACANAIDYSSTPLANVNSAFLDETGAQSYCSSRTPSFGAQGSVYAYVRLKMGVISVADAGLSSILAFGNAAGSGDYCNLIIGSSGGVDYWGVYTNAGATLGVTSPNTDTEYHVWLEYVKNTSCSAYISTTATKPGAATVSDTDGVTDSDAYAFSINSQDGTNDVDAIYFDNILVDNEVIGSQ